MRASRKNALCTLLTFLALFGIGCGTSPVIQHPHPVASRGKVYLFRGFAGVYSKGLDTLGDELAKDDFTVTVLPHDDWAKAAAEIRQTAVCEPIVLIGHSWGADDAIRLARSLDAPPRPIVLLLTLDPVTPPAVTANVQTVVNFYQTNAFWDHTPWWHGKPLAADSAKATALENIDIRRDRPDLVSPGLSHGTMTQSPAIQRELLARVERACPLPK